MTHIREVSAFGIGLVLLSSFSTVACGDIVLSYVTSSNSSIAPSVQASGVTGSSLTGGSGISFDGNGFSWSEWDGLSLGDAVSSNEYFQWGFTSSSAYDLSDLDIRYDALGNGPENLAIQVAINGGAFQTIYTDNAVATGGFDAADISLAAFSNVTSAVFRLFAWNANNDRGRLNLENSTAFGNAAIVVNGAATAVPEPASLALMGLAGVAAAVASHRRSRRRGATGAR